MLHGLIAHYLIEGTVGAGGMGVVYKATDTRLNRPVAIKALPEKDVVKGDAAWAEALAAASLDHPYICKVYELLEHGPHTLIVMEFVEGETLAAMLQRGTPPLSMTLRIATEIAEGLANAHARGIVHRDVKPSNVMVTPHGHIKLLDFGLAHTDALSAPSDQTRLAAIASNPQAGTPSYMSPEQALGDPVSARSDVFSLGVVLFECLTGTLPFGGGTAYAYLAAMLSEAPKPLAKLAPTAPADLVRLIEQCLEKNPARRPESAAALAVELRRLADDVTASRNQVTAGESARQSRRMKLVMAGAAVVALTATAIVVWPHLRSAGPTTRIGQSQPFVTWPSKEQRSRISPDGHWLAFFSDRDGQAGVYLQALDGGEAKPVSIADGDVLSHLWSPDGRELACVVRTADKTLLEIVPAFFGGTPRQTIPLPQLQPTEPMRAVRWIGRSVFLESGAKSLRRIDLDKPSVENLSESWRIDGALSDIDVRPDGQRVVYTVTKSGQQSLWTADLDGANARRITDDRFFARRPMWAGTGTTIIYQSNRGGQSDLWEMDPEGKRAWQLTSSQAEELPESTSADGSIVSFQQIFESANLVLLSPTDKTVRPITAETLSDFSPTSSADGQSIAFQRSQPIASQGYLFMDATLMVGSSRGLGLMSDARPVANGFAARLSPNGSLIAYLQRGSTGARQLELQVKDLRTGEVNRVSARSTLPQLSLFPVDWINQNLAWSRDSTELFFVEFAESGDGRAIARYRPSGAARDVLAATRTTDEISDVMLSPDGTTLAYRTWSLKSNTGRLHVFDLSSGGDLAIATFEGLEPDLKGWTADGAALVLVQQAGTRDAIDATYAFNVVTIRRSGERRVVARVDEAFVGTARLNAARDTLFVTRAIDGIHNLHALSLVTGRLRMVTDNRLPGVTFSGVEPLADGSTVCVRDERKNDIWLIRAATNAR